MPRTFHSIVVAGLLVGGLVTGAEAQVRPRTPLIRPYLERHFLPRAPTQGMLMPGFRMRGELVRLRALDRVRVRLDAIPVRRFARQDLMWGRGRGWELRDRGMLRLRRWSLLPRRPMIWRRRSLTI